MTTTPTPDYSRRCTDCRHRLPRGTCGEPERAGLFPPGHGFGVTWPPPLHGATCPAYEARQDAQEARQ